MAGLAAGCLDDGGPARSDDGSRDPDSDDSDPDDSDANDAGGDEDQSGAESDGDDPREVTETPRVDEPPHDIEAPGASDEWNEDYLGEAMSPEPSLEFDVLDGVWLEESALESAAGGETGGSDREESDQTDDETDEEIDDETGEEFGSTSADPAYAVRLVEDRSHLESAVDLESTGETIRTALEDVDFDDSVVVIVESGWGSSSVGDRWVRVEDDGEAIHLHGYQTDPFVATTDVTTRHSVLVVDRPDDLAFARASLTASEDRRVHVNSTEGVVSLDD